jgi:hypothetical protein
MNLSGGDINPLRPGGDLGAQKVGRDRLLEGALRRELVRSSLRTSEHGKNAFSQGNRLLRCTAGASEHLVEAAARPSFLLTPSAPVWEGAEYLTDLRGRRLSFRYALAC